MRAGCREAEFSGLAIPSYGRAIGPQQKPLHAYEQRSGDQIGLNWMITRAVRRASRHVLFDTNWWKSFLFDRFAVSPGAAGSLSLFGTDPMHHHLLAEHLTSEIPHQIESKLTGRTVTTWDLIPGRANHWLDCLVGCSAAASITGVVLPRLPRPTAPPASAAATPPPKFQVGEHDQQTKSRRAAGHQPSVSSHSHPDGELPASQTRPLRRLRMPPLRLPALRGHSHSAVAKRKNPAASDLPSVRGETRHRGGISSRYSIKRLFPNAFFGTSQLVLRPSRRYH